LTAVRTGVASAPAGVVDREAKNRVWGWKACRAALALRGLRQSRLGAGGPARPAGDRRRLGLPLGDQGLVGGLGLLGELAFAASDRLAVVGGGRTALAASGRQPGSQLEGPLLLGDQRWPGEGVVGVVDDEVASTARRACGRWRRPRSAIPRRARMRVKNARSGPGLSPRPRRLRPASRGRGRDPVW
jgi:hypothetical protein